jgi:outer membrane receptor protein involved in Fe transport
MGITACGAILAAPAAAQQFDEIIVTAQKREQSLLEVPAAVSAISGDSLQAAGIESVGELEFYIPSLVIAENSGSAVVATAMVTRGIGVNGNLPYFEPSTALFIDGAYRSRSALGLDDLVNIDRVEYLRGPQSTLYGRNASAGVLSVLTKRPRDEWGGFVDVTGQVETVGEDPFGFLAKGEASGPISDTVGAGLSFTYRNLEDIFEVTGSPQIDSVNDEEAYTVRGQLEFKPSDALNVRLTGGLGDRELNGPASELFFDAASFGLFTLLEGFNDGLRARLNGEDLGEENNETFDGLLALGVVPTAEGVPVTPPHNDAWDRRIHLDEAKFGGLDGSDVALDIRYELANGWTINAVSSYNEYKASDHQDLDQTTLPIGTYEETQEGDAFGQEIRLSSKAGDGAVDWIVGAFYLKDELSRQVEFQIDADGPLLGAGLDGDVGQFVGSLDTDSISVFGDITWRPSEKWELAGGLRWIREEKDAIKTNRRFNGTDPVSDAFLGGPFASVFDPSDSGSDDLSTSDLTYSLRVSYNVNDDLLLYGLHSRGFKSGTFNVVWGPVGPAEDGFEVKDEKVDAFELGVKGTFAGGRVQLSADVYHQTHEDYQTAAFVGTIFNLSNAKEASTQGIEVDAQWAPTDRLRLSANLALTDAEFEEFTTAPCSTVDTPDEDGNCDQSGYQLPFVSDWNATLGAEYQRPLPIGELSLRADLAIAGDYNPDLQLAPYFEQDGYERLNLRATWGTERFDLTGFVSNLTDAEIVDWAGASNLGAGTTSGQFIVQSGRTFGVTGRVKF